MTGSVFIVSRFFLCAGRPGGYDDTYQSNLGHAFKSETWIVGVRSTIACGVHLAVQVTPNWFDVALNDFTIPYVFERTGLSLSEVRTSSCAA
jgi:hypothetical protein